MSLIEQIRLLEAAISTYKQKRYPRGHPKGGRFIDEPGKGEDAGAGSGRAKAKTSAKPTAARQRKTSAKDKQAGDKGDQAQRARGAVLQGKGDKAGAKKQSGAYNVRAERAAKAKADRLDQIVKALATEAPRALLGESAIDGLEIRDGDIWLDGVRFGGLCGMEQLLIAVEVAKRVAGDLRVLFVDGLERIAADQLDEVIGRATDGGFAFIATRVERGKIQFVTLDHVPIPATFTPAKGLGAGGGECDELD